MTSNAKSNTKSTMSREDLIQAFSRLKEEARAGYPIDQALTQLTSVKLRPTGRTQEGLCPFHMEKTPSFKVDAQRGNYKCWGCGEAGDVFTLIQVTQGLDFQSSIIFAAEKAGAHIPHGIRDFVSRRPAASEQKRRVVRYAASMIRPAPQGLGNARLIPIEKGTIVPEPNKRFPIWTNGGRDGTNRRTVYTYNPEMVHEYRDVDGKHLMSILRVKTPQRKHFVPARLMTPTDDCPKALIQAQTDNGRPLAWVSVGPDQGEAKPIYGMEDVREWYALGGKVVLIVEGEKTRDAAKRLVKVAANEAPWLVLTPMGGSKSAIYADFAPLFDVIGSRKVTFVQWPDADQPLRRPDGSVEDRLAVAVNQVQTVIAQRALDRGVLQNMALFHVTPPTDVASGWDLADAEAEGWSSDVVVKYIRANAAKTDMSKLVLRAPSKPDDPGAKSKQEDPAVAGPFDLAGDPADEADELDWLEAFEDMASENCEFLNDDCFSGPAEDGTVMTVPAFGAMNDLGAASAADLDVTDQTLTDSHFLTPDELEDEELDEKTGGQFFRCLGHLDGKSYFLSLKSGQVFDLTPAGLQQNTLLHLAPLNYWSEKFPKFGRPHKDDKNAPVVGVNWVEAVDALIQATYSAGIWNPRLRCYQGARMDGGTVVFHSGTCLYVDGRGIVPLDKFSGKYIYASSTDGRMPDVDNPFPADSAEVREYLRILCSLDWNPEFREISIMSLFGWVALSVITGILKWRPHIWLDGPRGSGKSWIIVNLVNKVLNGFVQAVKANSSEPGIRNVLDARAVPVTFDEAEGDGKENKLRMSAILGLARHSASEGDSVVAQGVSGGGGSRNYSIASSFLMTSIVPQVIAAADRSRFAQIKLGPGRKHDGFKAEVEVPALNLLTETFRDRWLGRMITRARDYHETYMHMVHGLSRLGMERRLADLYGSFATGCWLMLRDGVPADENEAAMFLQSEFNVMESLINVAEDVGEDKDHVRLFVALQSHLVRLDGQNNAGSRSEALGDLIEVACGHVGEGNCLITQDEARQVLARLGMRPGVGSTPAGDQEVADTLLIHKNSQPIRDILEKTSYATSYSDVMSQASDVKNGKPSRFGAGFGTTRPLIVPLKHFNIGVENG